MTQAVRRTTAERGVDPRELQLLAYGGNGPLFAAIQAQELGIGRVLVPKASPAFSALGALAARPSVDEERSYLAPAPRADLARLRALFEELDARAEGFLAAAGHARQELCVRYQLNLRYPGQNWSLAVPVAERRGARDLAFLSANLLEGAVADFHRLHREEYGHARLAEEPELTGVRLSASCDVAAPRFAGGFSAPRREPAPRLSRRANLGEGFRETAVFRGPELRPGDAVRSPAVIEESFTTIAVYPGFEARVDDAGDYVLERVD